MSFNIGPVFWRVKIKEVTLTLASMKLVGCTVTVMLNANITVSPGDNIAAHRFEWEQIAGDPVIWLEDQDQPSVTWQYPDEFRTDRTFRFWVDRGTNVEQFADILVTAIPRSDFSQGTSVNPTYFTTTDSVSGIAANPYTAHDLYGFNTSVESPTAWIISWTGPTDFTAVRYEVERFDAPSMTWVHESYLLQTVIVLPMANTHTIRITAYDKYSHTTSVVFSIPSILIPPYIPQTTIQPGVTVQHSRSVNPITLTTFEVDSTTVMSPPTANTTRIVQNFSLLILPTNITDTTRSDPTIAHTRTVQTFTGGSLG